MHASVLPTIWDIGGLIGYVFGNPWLFISSSTVMTTGLIIGAAVVTTLPLRSAVLRPLGPTLALILMYFGAGSFLLSLQILIRFHDTIPNETEIQFVSGFGHLVEAAVGIALLRSHLRRHPLADWLWAHNLALGYWVFQIAVLTPPWFAFQGQREIVTTAALSLLAAAAVLNTVLWTRRPH